jgi:hypothetical protein
MSHLSCHALDLCFIVGDVKGLITLMIMASELCAGMIERFGMLVMVAVAQCGAVCVEQLAALLVLVSVGRRRAIDVG